MLHRQHYKGLIKKNPAQDGTKLSDGKKVHDEPNLIIEMFDRQNKLNSNFRSWDLEKAIRWMMGYANFINQNAQGHYNKFTNRRFSKGTILTIDFFGSFGGELTYDHPAIVLAEAGHDLIVAPISSTPTLYNDPHFYHIKLPKNVPCYGSLKCNSVAKIEQLRYVSKKRILEQNKRVSDNAKLEEIDRAVMQYVSRNTYNDMVFKIAELDSDLLTEREETKRLETENEKLKIKLDALEKRQV